MFSHQVVSEEKQSLPSFFLTFWGGLESKPNPEFTANRNNRALSFLVSLVFWVSTIHKNKHLAELISRNFRHLS